MYQWRNNLSRLKSISWVLVVTILSLALLPSCLHVHHDDNETAQGEHRHIIDLHIGIDNIVSPHSNDAETMELGPDTLIKKKADNPQLPALVAYQIILISALFLLSGLSACQTRRTRAFSWLHIHPPLRAPPVLH